MAFQYQQAEQLAPSPDLQSAGDEGIHKALSRMNALANDPTAHPQVIVVVSSAACAAHDLCRTNAQARQMAQSLIQQVSSVPGGLPHGLSQFAVPNHGLSQFAGPESPAGENGAAAEEETRQPTGGGGLEALAGGADPQAMLRQMMSSVGGLPGMPDPSGRQLQPGLGAATGMAAMATAPIGGGVAALRGEQQAGFPAAPESASAATSEAAAAPPPMAMPAALRKLPRLASAQTPADTVDRLAVFSMSLQHTAIMRECLRSLQVESLTDVLGKGGITSLAMLKEHDEEAIMSILRDHVVAPLMRGVQTL